MGGILGGAGERGDETSDAFYRGNNAWTLKSSLVQFGIYL